MEESTYQDKDKTILQKMEELGLFVCMNNEKLNGNWSIELTDACNDFFNKVEANPSQIVSFLTVSLLTTLEAYGVPEDFMEEVLNRMREDFKRLRQIRNEDL